MALSWLILFNAPPRPRSSTSTRGGVIIDPKDYVYVRVLLVYHYWIKAPTSSFGTTSVGDFLIADSDSPSISGLEPYSVHGVRVKTHPRPLPQSGLTLPYQRAPGPPDIGKKAPGPI